MRCIGKVKCLLVFEGCIGLDQLVVVVLDKIQPFSICFNGVKDASYLGNAFQVLEMVLDTIAFKGLKQFRVDIDDLFLLKAAIAVLCLQKVLV